MGTCGEERSRKKNFILKGAKDHSNHSKIKKSKLNNSNLDLNEYSEFNVINKTLETPLNNKKKNLVKKSINSKIDKNINNDKNKAQNSDYQYHEVQTLKGHSDKIASLTELYSGCIATGSYDCTIRIWDLNKNECVMIKEDKGTVFCLLEFEPNMVLAGTSNNNIGLWNLSSQNNEIEFNFLQHELWVTSLVKCDDDHFASGGNDSNIFIWDYKNRKYKYSLTGHKDCVLSLIKLKDGNLCSGSTDLTIKIWDWKNKTLNLDITTPHKKWIKCLCQLRDGTLLSGSEYICVWSEKDLFTPIKRLSEHKHYTRTICQIDDNHFASGSFDETIKIWNIKDFTVTQTIKAHDSNIICIIKLKNNKLVSCSNDMTIKIWDKNN